MTAPTCSFCGRDRKGGVAGPTLEIYICRDCIRLAAVSTREHEPEPPNEGPGGAA